MATKKTLSEDEIRNWVRKNVPRDAPKPAAKPVAKSTSGGNMFSDTAVLGGVENFEVISKKKPKAKLNPFDDKFTLGAALKRAGGASVDAATKNRVAKGVGSAIPKPARNAAKTSAKGALKAVGTASDYIGRPLKAAAVGSAVNSQQMVGKDGKPLTAQQVYDMTRGGDKSGIGLRTDPNIVTPGEILRGEVTDAGKVLFGRDYEAGKIKNPLLRSGALLATAGLEVITDPTTFVTPGVGASKSAVASSAKRAAVHEAEAAAAKQAAKEAAKAGDKTLARSLSKQAAESSKLAKLAANPVTDTGRKAIAKKLFEAGDEAAANKALIKGRNALSGAELESVGLQRGIKVGGNKGVVVGGERTDKAIQALGRVNPLTQAPLKAREKLLPTKLGQDLSARLGRVEGGSLVEKNKGAIKRVGYDEADLMARRANEGASAELRRSAAAAGVDAKAISKFEKNNGDVFYRAVEGDATAAEIAQIELQLPGALEKVRKEFYDRGLAKVTADGTPVPYKSNYQRKVLTDEARQILRDNAARIEKKYGKIEDLSIGKSSIKAPTRVLNEQFRAEYGVDLFSTDTVRSMNAYADQVGKAAGDTVRAKQMAKYGLLTEDVRVPDAAKAAQKAQAGQVVRNSMNQQASVAAKLTPQAELERQIQAGVARGQGMGLKGRAAGTADQAKATAAEAEALIVPGARNAKSSLDPLDQRVKSAVKGGSTPGNVYDARSLEARAAADVSTGAKRDTLVRKAEKFKEAAELDKQAAEYAAKGDQLLADALRVSSEGKALQAELESVKKGTQSAYLTYSKIDPTSLMSEIDTSLKRYMSAAGSDWLQDPSMVEPLLRLKQVASKETPYLLKQYDKILSGWKARNLVTPGFHIRNAMGGMMNNTLMGIDSDSYFIFLKNYRRYKAGGLEAIPNPTIRQGFQEAISRGAILTDDANLMVGEAIANLGQGRGPISKALHKPVDVSRKAGNVVEDQLRGSLFIDQFLKNGGNGEEAFMKTITAHFDGKWASRFENTTGRRFAPFWSYTRNNLPFQMEMMVRNPGFYSKFFDVQRGMAWNDGRDDQGRDPFGIRLPIDLNGNASFGTLDTGMAQLEALVDPLYAIKNSSPLIQQLYTQLSDKQATTGYDYQSLKPKKAEGTVGAIARTLDKAGLNLVDADGMISARTYDTIRRAIPETKYDKSLLGSGSATDQMESRSTQGFGVGLYVSTPERQTAALKRKVKASAGGQMTEDQIRQWIRLNVPKKAK